MDYIAAHDIKLPEQYSHGVMDSLECWNCTAAVWDALPEHLEAKLSFMARRYPDLLKQVAPQFEKIIYDPFPYRAEPCEASCGVKHLHGLYDLVKPKECTSPRSARQISS